MKYLEKWVELYHKNSTLIFVILFQTAIILVLLSTILFLSVKRNVVIAIPPTGTSIVAGSEAHKMLWGRYYIDVLTNFSKSDIDTRLNILFTFISNPEIKAKLLKEAEEIKKNDVSQVFIPYEPTWKVEGDIVSVKGRVKRFVGTTLSREEDMLVKVKLRPAGATILLEDWKYEKP